MIVKVLLRPLDEPLGYEPGQYILVNDLDYWIAQRSYSIANAPRREGRISLLVTNLAECPGLSG